MRTKRIERFCPLFLLLVTFSCMAGTSQMGRGDMSFDIIDDFNSTELADELWTYWTSGENEKIGVFPGKSDKDANDKKVIRLVYPAGHSIAGPPQGPNLESKRLCHFGIYSARIKSAGGNPDEGVVSGFFTYFNDIWSNPSSPTDLNRNGISDNSEIDFEFLAAEPETIYLSIWTDYQDEKFLKVTRKINMRTGEIGETPKGKENLYDLKPVEEKLAKTIPEYDHSKIFYEYSFEWRSDSVKYYILNDGEKILLWDFKRAEFIPQNPAHLCFNVWHNQNHWHISKPASPPKADAVFSIDRVSFKAQ